MELISKRRFARRALDATVLLIVTGNAYHLLTSACRWAHARRYYRHIDSQRSVRDCIDAATTTLPISHVR